MANACQAVEPERNTTRLYFDGRSDQLLAARNDAWVLYAFLWHLLLMDYANGEDFTHWLIMAAPLLAFGLVLAGLVLTALALRRSWRTRRRHQVSAQGAPS